MLQSRNLSSKTLCHFATNATGLHLPYTTTVGRVEHMIMTATTVHQYKLHSLFTTGLVSTYNQTKMFCCKQSCRLIVRSTNVLRNYTTTDHPSKGKVKFFAKILEFPTTHAARTFLKKNECVMHKEQSDLFDSFKYLTEIGITIEDIRNQPKILCCKRTTLRNRYEILGECGCHTVNIFFLHKYLTLCVEPETSLKKVGIIADNIDLQQRLADCLNIKLLPCSVDKSLTTVRMHILRAFLLQNDYITAEEFNSIITKHPYVTHKSFRWIKAILNILTNEFNIPTHEIKDNFSMFQADPDNLKQLLAMKSIGGVNMTEILRQTPNLMLAPSENVKYTLAQLKKLDFGEDTIKKCSSALALDWKTMSRRLSEFKSNKELLAMNFHPSVLKLVVKTFQGQSRVNHLNDLDKKCYNMSALTGALTQFEKFCMMETDRHIPRDCVLFLAKNLQMDTEIVKKEIRRHPYWLYVPFVEMKHTIDVLKQARFELDDIAENIHIVLYHGELVLNRLKMFNGTEQIEGEKTKSLSKSMQLKLILYQIEKEFHFSGDGVWLDRKSNLNFE